MDVEKSLQPWDESYLIMVYDLFNVLLDMDCSYFVEDFCIYCSLVILACNFLSFFFVVSLSGFGSRVMVAS